MSTASDRASIANEVFGTADSSPEISIDLEQKQESLDTEAQAAETNTQGEPEKDPWDGVPIAIREEVEGLRAKVAGIDDIGFRLKQTENRLGGVLNELHAAKNAAKAVDNAPTKEQIEQAAKNKADWDELKNDFPEWTNAMDSKLAAERSEILKQLPDVDAIRKEIQEASGAEMNKLKTDFAEKLISIKHPKWIETIKTDEFARWHEKTGQKDSTDPLEVIAIFDEFSEFKAKQKSPVDIAAERKKRLEEHQQQPNGHKLPPIKSEADMSESEIRAQLAKQVWA